MIRISLLVLLAMLPVVAGGDTNIDGFEVSSASFSMGISECRPEDHQWACIGRGFFAGSWQFECSFCEKRYRGDWGKLSKKECDLIEEWCGLRPDAIDLIDPNSIRHICQSGRVCKVIGHNWRDGRPGESCDEDSGFILAYADYHPHTNYRTCRACGLCQSQDLSWK